MEKLRFSITIQAPAEKVWKTMLEDETYRQWTAEFHPGSYYEGEWKEGEDIRFLGPDTDGTTSGMISRVKEVRPYEFTSLQHLGITIKGQDTLWTPEDMEYQEVLEQYTFNDLGGATEVVVELDTNEDYKKMFEESWPKALDKLKQIVEAGE